MIKYYCLILLTVMTVMTSHAYSTCTEITFMSEDYAYKPVSVTATGEDVDITVNDAPWLQMAEVPSIPVKADTKAVFYVAPNGPTVTERHASITLTGRTTGKTFAVNITQQPVDASDGYPARWHNSISETHDSEWLDCGNLVCNMDKGSAKARITAVGVNNRRLGHVITTSYKYSPGISGMDTGDYLLFSFPAASLPAGTDVDLMINISAADNTAPKYWIAEILDGGQWVKPRESDLKQINGEDYSFYIKHFKSYQHCTFLQTFTLKHPATSGMVQMRCRVVGNLNGADSILSPSDAGTVYLAAAEFLTCTMTAYPHVPASGQEKKVAILGNSFTYCHGTQQMLKELARSQGHRLNVKTFAKGSQYFRHHLILEMAGTVTSETGYDYVFLQDQSAQHCIYTETHDQAIVDDTKALSAQFRKGSPNAHIVLENTWAFPKKDWHGYGSADKFENMLLEGTKAIVRADANTGSVSPIGVAFNAAYHSGITDLWNNDQKHQNRNGAYLKACVNYLVIFGEPFNDKASDCGCDPLIASRLREIAMQTVLGHEAEYYIER